MNHEQTTASMAVLHGAPTAPQSPQRRCSAAWKLLRAEGVTPAAMPWEWAVSKQSWDTFWL